MNILYIVRLYDFKYPHIRYMYLIFLLFRYSIYSICLTSLYSTVLYTLYPTLRSNNGTGGWSNYGIIQDGDHSPPVICEATHLTSFSVLVSSFDAAEVCITYCTPYILQYINFVLICYCKKCFYNLLLGNIFALDM